MQRSFLIIAAFSMAIAIILGAMATHALKVLVPPGAVSSFETGVRYQVWHSLAIFIVQILPVGTLSQRLRRSISILFVLGIAFFSFSIYLLSLSTLIKNPELSSWVGPVTPIGGLLLILAWILLGIGILQYKSVA